MFGRNRISMNMNFCTGFKTHLPSYLPRLVHFSSLFVATPPVLSPPLLGKTTHTSGITVITQKACILILVLHTGCIIGIQTKYNY